MDFNEEILREAVRTAAENTSLIMDLLDPEIREELQELFYPVSVFLRDKTENQNILE